MLFVVRRLQELGRARKIPLYIFFIDLQKTYDFVDRELLWVVLARFGVPEKMLTVIRPELACVWMIVSTRKGMTSPRGCRTDVYCNRFFSMSSLL